MRKELQKKVDLAILSRSQPLKAESGRVNYFNSKGG